MLEPFIYPVSGVLKIWHVLLHSLLGVDDSTAWVISVFGLVLTVRGFLAPFFWAQIKSARISVAMRPEQVALREEHASRTDKESVAEFQAKTKEIHERHGFTFSSGCVPALVQLPVFLGLYQVLLRMARPSENLEVDPDARIGLLNATDIAGFLRAEVNGVPLPAYVAMPERYLSELGTTSAEVRSFIMPLLIAAVVFTVGNMIISIIRSYRTLDWESRASRGAHNLMIVMTLAIPFILVSLALNAPLPVAIILYWFANNLWTLTQTVILQPLVHRRVPLDASFEEFSREQRRTVQAALREKRAQKRDIRRRRLTGLVQPWRIPEIRRELNAEKQERREAAAASKAEKKAIAKAKSAASSELMKERVEKRRAERAARKAPRSNSRPEEPTASDGPDPAPSAEE